MWVSSLSWPPLSHTFLQFPGKETTQRPHPMHCGQRVRNDVGRREQVCTQGGDSLALGGASGLGLPQGQAVVCITVGIRCASHWERAADPGLSTLGKALQQPFAGTMLSMVTFLAESHSHSGWGRCVH